MVCRVQTGLAALFLSVTQTLAGIVVLSQVLGSYDSSQGLVGSSVAIVLSAIVVALGGVAASVFILILTKEIVQARSRLGLVARAGHELRTPQAIASAWIDQYRATWVPPTGATIERSAPQVEAPGLESPDPAIMERQLSRMRVMTEGLLHGANRGIHRPRTRISDLQGRTALSRDARTARSNVQACVCTKAGGASLLEVLGDLSALWPGPDRRFPEAAADGIAIPRLRMETAGLMGLYQVRGDERFTHIVSNVLQNAFRHGIPRARPLLRPWEVRLHAELDPGGLLRIRIVDPGPGVVIDPWTGLPKSRWPEESRERSNGLGFFIVRELVDSAGGSITIGTPTGARQERRLKPRGCQVTVILPIENPGNAS